MREPTHEDPPGGDPDVTEPEADVDAEEIVNEQQPGLDPAGPTELGDAIDG